MTCLPDLPWDLWLHRNCEKILIFNRHKSHETLILDRREFRFFRWLSRMVSSLNQIVVT